MGNERIQISSDGPPDVVPVSQEIIYEESESDDPDAEMAMESVQDVRP